MEGGRSTNEVLFQSFLKDAASQVESWLVNNSFSLSDLPSVISAYSLIFDQLDEDKQNSLKTKMENVLFENATHLKPKEAVYMIQSMCTYATPQTVELLDRVIGAGIYEIETSLLLPTLKSFLSA